MKCIKNLVVVSFSALCFSMSPGTASARDARVASASGSNLTFESLLGFPRFAACASLRDARRKIHHRFVGRSASA